MDRLHSPDTGTGGMIDDPDFGVPVVRAPLFSSGSELPDNFQVVAVRSSPTQSSDVFQSPVPCS